ncbi:MAG: lipid IV(A) 3-deoxy-D-manno-octulosonic acid transferase [Hahellaceae bacterium]|nr:lipid IV(A) 3-deoxy-D-manno-octulosonic acid transferase [Hahellaceae bacterium]MCP5210564.1 lipid IV(A) 3-deoxy-D-manno-octulosonic acid transferase [Hahellaceae bacterium]
MGRLIYTALFLMLYPLILLRLWHRSRKAPAYAQRWRERLGYYPQELATVPHQSIWVHAVSVGETIAALPLIRALQERHPAIPVIVTTMTPTGSERVQAALGSSVIHVYAPYDSPGAIKRFLRQFRPRLLVIMETELWPNTIHYARLSGAKVALVNARLSERSARGYGKVSWLSRPLMRNLDIILSQGQSDADRFKSLGVPAANITVTGSIKFDLAVSDECLQQGAALREKLGQQRPVWIAASTHDGEDEALLRVHRSLQETLPDLCLILVPRHPERFNDVVQLAARAGYRFGRKSCPETISADIDVLVGDTMGEMMGMYAASDVAFVGGSLVQHGGHNPLEPAALGLPIVMGEHVFNFADICARLEQVQGLTRVRDEHALQSVLQLWFQNRDVSVATGANAQRFQRDSRGSLKQVLDQLDSFLQQ